MISKRSWTTSTLLLLSAVGPLSSGVWAQTTSMAVCAAGFEWVRSFRLRPRLGGMPLSSWLRGRSHALASQNQNSLGQDPCAISSILDAACRGVGKCLDHGGEDKVSI